MKPAAELRREGMADACVLFVAAKWFPNVSLEEWGNVLGLEQVELREAIVRWRVAQYDAAGVPLPHGLERPPADDERRLAVVKPIVRDLPCTDAECERMFADLRALKAHVRMVHATATCPDCGFVTTSGGLLSHRRARHALPAVAAPDAVADPAPLAASGTGAVGHA